VAREILSVTQVLLAFGVVVLVLMHSGKDSGLSGMFNPGGGSGYGGTAVMERNLTRWTIILAILFVLNAMVLGYFLNH